MTDELAARRAAKGRPTVTIGAGDHKVVWQLELDPSFMKDELATRKARRRRRRARPI